MAHIHDLIDVTIGGFIVHQNNVLLINHLKLKKWLCVGGHIELDEDPEQALFREIEEESGIKKEDLTVLSDKPKQEFEGNKFLYTPNSLNIHKISDTHQHIGLVYYLTSKTDRVELAENEHSGIRWFSEEDLDNPEFDLKEDVKFYCRQALEAAKEV
jgi:8-oxo-dGTP diphosphatase